MTGYLNDSNVWLALTVSGHPHHVGATRWFDSVAERSSVVFCRATQLSFLRLLTTPAVHARFGDPPLTNAEAWSSYAELLGDDRVSFRQEEPDELERWWSAFARRPSASPNLWMDAYLAAFARAASLTFVTNDRAFRQFDGLDVVVLDEGSSAPEPS